MGEWMYRSTLPVVQAKINYFRREYFYVALRVGVYGYVRI
jgi:hypothetical protein